MKKTSYIFTPKATGAATQVINPANGMSADQAFELCLPIILKTIRQLENKHDCQAGDFSNDLLQEGYIAVLDALGKYDPSHGTHFTTYAYNFIHGAICKAFKEESEHEQSQVPMDVYDPDSGEYVGNTYEYAPADPIYEADYAFQCQEARDECDRRLLVLNPIEQRIVKEVFGLNDGFEHSFEAIAFQLGISPERVRQLFNRAMSKLKKDEVTDAQTMPDTEGGTNFVSLSSTVA